MTDEMPDAVADAFDGHEAFELADGEYAVTTAAFDGTVSATTGEDGFTFEVTVSVPAIEAATADDVGPAVATDWLLTFKRRLEDAPKATRSDVELAEFDVTAEQGTVEVIYGFEWESPHRGATIAKTLVEYVEGTYVEGIIPGYEYVPPVSDLLASASQGGEHGTPL